MAIWTNTESGSYWSDAPGEEEIIRIQEIEDQIVSNLTRVFSVSDCDSTTGSFFHDMKSDRLYVHTTNNDTPRSSKYTFQAFSIIACCNRQDPVETIDFIPEGATLNTYYRPIISARSINSLNQSVSEFFQSTIKSQFGNISLGDPFFWWKKQKLINFHNKKIRIKIGNLGDEYSSYTTIFTGKIKNPNFSNNGFSFNVIDSRAGIFSNIPRKVYDTIAYPNLKSNLENKPIPILFGIKTGIKPDNINTTNYTYKISDTSFLTTYPIQQIDNVYLDGVEIYSPGDYTADLNNGTITLTSDPGSSEVTVNARGLKCGYDLSTGSKDNNFTENTAEILFFLLTELNNVPPSEIDLNSFSDLKTKRTQRIGAYFRKSISTESIINNMQQSSLFHFFPNNSGKHMVRYYDRTGEENIKSYDNPYYMNFELLENSESIFKNLILYYNKNTNDDDFQSEIYENTNVGNIYDEEKTLEITTYLTNQDEAKALLEFYSKLVRTPTQKINIGLNDDNLELLPTDKLYINRSIYNEKYEKLDIAKDELYVILESRKKLGNLTSDLTVIPDVQASGGSIRVDIPGYDDYSQYTDHVNTAYIDEHINQAYQQHSDYDDIPHLDSHEDFTYPYVDDYQDYFDIIYINKYTEHEDYLNVAHQDRAHVDYTDEVNVPYQQAYTEGYGEYNDHINSYQNIPYTNSVT